MARSSGRSLVLPMDVANDAEIDAAFTALRAQWDTLDILVHSVAFAPREQLAGGYLDSITREGFQVAHDISSYSLAALAKAARPMMLGRPGAILTMSYLGAVRSVPSYNVMGLAKASLEANVRFLAADLGPHGIRVNAISAGPIKTLAAAGVERIPQDAAARRVLHAAAPQRDHRGGGQRRGLPLLRPRVRHHRRSAVRGCRVQPRGNGVSGGRKEERLVSSERWMARKRPAMPAFFIPGIC